MVCVLKKSKEGTQVSPGPFLWSVIKRPKRKLRDWKMNAWESWKGGNKTRVNRLGTTIALATVVAVLLFALFGIVLAADPTAQASRTISPKVVEPGDPVAITVVFKNVLNVTKSFALKENIPNGWAFSRGTDDAFIFRYGPPPEWVWIGVGAGVTKTVTYNLTVPVDAEAGNYTINGTVTSSNPDTENPVLGDATITVRVFRNLTISSTAGGSVTFPGEGTFPYDTGTVVNLAAVADEGYRFDQWTGSVSTIVDVYEASTTIVMNGDYNITASFMAVYDLTTNSTEGGSVTQPAEGTFTYDEGTVIDLLAVADACYEFINWTGDVGTIADADAASTNITMNADYSITANFALINCDYLDYYGGWEFYCVGDEVWKHQRFHDFSCVNGTCVEVSSDYVDDQLVEDCNDLDGWYDVGATYACCDGNSSCTCQDQEYRDYYCSDGSCTYSVTDTRTQKTNCTDCDDQDYLGDWEYYCQGDQVWMHQIFHDFSCVNGTCVEVSSDYVNDQLVEDCNALDGWVEDGDPYTECDGDQVCTYQDMVYLDYSCVGGECVSTPTDWRTDLIGCESCDDQDPCTIDTCENGVCVHTPLYADILEYYRGLYDDPDEISTLELLAAVDDWLADVAPPCFEEPITTLVLLELVDEWISSG